MKKNKLKNIAYAAVGALSVFLLVVFAVNYSRFQNSMEVMRDLSIRLHDEPEAQHKKMIDQAIQMMKENQPLKFDLIGKAVFAQYYYQDYCSATYEDIGWGTEAYYATGDKWYLEVAINAVNQYVNNCLHYS